MTNPLPADLLEQRAIEQRQRLHDTVSVLRSGIRDRLDVTQNARENFWPAASVVFGGMLVLGYALAGVFTRE